MIARRATTKNRIARTIEPMDPFERFENEKGTGFPINGSKKSTFATWRWTGLWFPPTSWEKKLEAKKKKRVHVLVLKRQIVFERFPIQNQRHAIQQSHYMVVLWVTHRN